MTQDRRKDDKLPEGPLVFTDRNLTAAGLAHLEAERAAACLVHAGGDVWVGVGTKGALRGLLSEDTASQSQAVPSELASRLRNMSTCYADHECPPIQAKMLRDAADEIDRLSHSAATGKVPEAHRWPLKEGAAAYDRAWRSNAEPHDCMHDAVLEMCRILDLASPAAPLAGKAEANKQADGWPEEIYLQAGDDPLGHFSEYDEVSWCDHPQGESDVRYVRADAPLAAAVPAEEARCTTCDGTGMAHRADGEYLGECNCDAPAEPAPIPASALTDERITELNREAQDQAISGIEPSIYLARAIERELLARLSKPTAQGTASRPNADCSGEPSNCPDNEGYGCACGYGAPVAADAAVTAQSIDTPKLRELMERFAEWRENGCNGDSPYVEILAHIAAHAPAGRDAQQWISVEERLPSDDCRVLAATWFTMDLGQHLDIVSFRSGSGQFSHSDVTHWMPLPAAPTAEGEKK